MKAKILFGTLAVLGLWAARVDAQVTVNSVITNGLYEPEYVVVDQDDNYYVSNSVSNRVVKVDANTQALTTLAGIPTDLAGANDGPAYWRTSTIRRGCCW